MFLKNNFRLVALLFSATCFLSLSSLTNSNEAVGKTYKINLDSYEAELNLNYEKALYTGDFVSGGDNISSFRRAINRARRAVGDAYRQIISGPILVGTGNNTSPNDEIEPNLLALVHVGMEQFDN